jgi:hypothetical protein
MGVSKDRDNHSNVLNFFFMEKLKRIGFRLRCVRL